MKRDARSFLWDIEQAADAIGRFISGGDRRAQAESDLVRSAVERKFEIIGEALAQLARTHPEIAERVPDFREIIAFRNILVHGYAAIEHDRVWRVARDSLPHLRAVVAALISELGRDQGLSLITAGLRSHPPPHWRATLADAGVHGVAIAAGCHFAGVLRAVGN